MTPKRIQLRRTKGWKKPENTTVVTRNTRWGNPFVVGKDGTRAECVAKFAELMMPFRRRGQNSGLSKFFMGEAILWDIQHELRGKNLACSCLLCEDHADGKPLGVECLNCETCHADVLLRWANNEVACD
jgi:hypothetical protein